MKRPLFILLAITMATVSLRASAQAGALVDAQQIATALADVEIGVSASQVQLLAQVRATSVEPALEVMSVDSWEGKRAKVRLRCRNRRQCLPFYVVVHWPDQKATDNAVRRWAAAAPRISPPAVPHQPWLAHRGESATLVIEGEHLRIQLPVICLANGSAGKSIRVTTADYKRIYVAKVVGIRRLTSGL